MYKDDMILIVYCIKYPPQKIVEHSNLTNIDILQIHICQVCLHLVGNALNAIKVKYKSLIGYIARNILLYKLSHISNLRYKLELKR